MSRLLLTTASKVLAACAALALLSGLPAWSQDDSPEDAPDPAAEGEAGQGAEAPGDVSAGESDGEEDGDGPAVGLDENPELDEQTYEKDDDDFIPSEEIPVDQSIPFPTDI